MHGVLRILLRTLLKVHICGITASPRGLAHRTTYALARSFCGSSPSTGGLVVLTPAPVPSPPVLQGPLQSTTTNKRVSVTGGSDDACSAVPDMYAIPFLRCRRAHPTDTDTGILHVRVVVLLGSSGLAVADTFLLVVVGCRSLEFERRPLR